MEGRHTLLYLNFKLLVSSYEKIKIDIYCH